MKPCKAAAGVACLSAAIGGAFGTPVRRSGRAQAAETLKNAMTDSIEDAIRSAVSHVVTRKAHHVERAAQPATSALPDNVVAVAKPALLSVGSRNATKASPAKAKITDAKAETRALTQRSRLRGRAGHKAKQQASAQDQNPWEPAMPLRILDHALDPVAPMDRLTPGVEAQGGGVLPPGYWPRVTYYPESQDYVNPFPQHYSAPVPDPPQNYLVCKTSPSNWVDASPEKRNCEYYGSALWCTADGKEGPQWSAAWGSLAKFAKDGVGPAQACCECGGGARVPVVGSAEEIPMSKRRLYAPEDRLPDPAARWFERNNGHLTVPPRPLRPNQAPEDYVPIPMRQVAPADEISMHYSRYFREIHNEHGKPDPRGMSVRYYSVPPTDCSLAKPVASAIVPSLDYASVTDLLQGPVSLVKAGASQNVSQPIDLAKYDPVYLGNPMALEWPLNREPVGKIWYAKWTGTVVILDPGKYTFNLDVGFNTKSQLKVDGVPVLTDGQCRVSKDEGTCKAKGCKWHKDTGVCGAAGGKAKEKGENPTCAAGTYRASPVLFGSKAHQGTQEVMIGPASATTVLTIPKGVKDFRITIDGKDTDLQLWDEAAKTWVVKFGSGVVNDKQRHGTYHGMAISFSGDNPAQESAALNGVIDQPIMVQILSYSPNPQMVKMSYSHGGISGSGKKVEGCKKLDTGKAQKAVGKWQKKMKERYMQCSYAWAAVKKVHPGGQISWSQWESVWAMAWGQATASGEAGGPDAWQPAFAVVDSSKDGYVAETEFMTACGEGGAPGPSPAPGPAPAKAPTLGAPSPSRVVLDNCLAVKVKDKASWPKEAFKDTGFKDHERLSELIGSPVKIKSKNPKGVMLPSPDGSQNGAWFYPVGTFYCYQATSGAVAPSPQGPMVSSRGPAPSIANIEPTIVGPLGQGPSPGPAAVGRGLPAGLIQDAADLPAASLEKAIDLSAGGHCIEVTVMVTPSARDLKLRYSGPDTHNKESVISGQLLHCDPIIPACTDPARSVCGNYRSQCPPAPGPAPGPALSPA